MNNFISPCKRNVRKNRNLKLKAFSTLELLIYLTIVGIILMIAIPNIKTIRNAANEFACKSEMESIKSALELWHTKYQEYPSGLKDLVNESYISQKALADPWKNEYIYRVQYQNKKSHSYLLLSPGGDGIQGTEDDIQTED